jgi:hypothetical protein
LEKAHVRSRENRDASRPGATRAWKRFIPYIASVIALVVLMAFLVISLMNTRLIRKEIRMKAETLLESIILARRWNASFGGVFVEKGRHPILPVPKGPGHLHSRRPRIYYKESGYDDP